MKECRKCGEEKPLSGYYKHKQMKDGHLNICKECTKKRVGRHRKYNIDRIRAYDRERGNRQSKQYKDQYKKKYPNKYKAHTMVNNAIRDKRLFKEPCEVCNCTEKIHAHHDDYAKPLNIRWLCAEHHRQWHIENGEAKNP